MKRFLSFVLTLVMVVGICSSVPFNITASAACGDNLTWTYDSETTTLTISGTGDMCDFNVFDMTTDEGVAPWYMHRYDITVVRVEEGVTSLGSNSIFGYLSEVYLPSSLTSISEDAFSWSYYDGNAYGFYPGTAEQLASLSPNESVPGGFYWHYETDEHTPEDKWTYDGFFDCESDGYATRYKFCIYCNKELDSELIEMGHIIVDGECEVCGVKEFEYYVNEETNTAVIQGYNGRDSHMNIPEYINGYRVVGIADGAFDYSYYDEMDVESDYWHVEKITIPQSVTYIGEYAFRGTGYYHNDANWDSTGSLYIGDCLITAKKESCVRHSVTPSDYSVAEGTRLIADAAFDYCVETKNINIPSSVEVIGEIDFRETLCEDCQMDDYDDISFASHLTAFNVSIDNKYYSSQDGILFNKDKTTLIKYPNSKPGKTYTIPDNVTAVESAAFQSLYLEKIVIGAGVTELYGGEFSGAKALKQFAVNSSNAHYVAVDGVLFSSDKKTLIRYPVKKVVSYYAIPNRTEKVSGSAFYGVSLNSLAIPEGVSFGMGAFADSCVDYIFYAGESNPYFTGPFGSSIYEMYYGYGFVYAAWHYNCTNHTYGEWITDKKATTTASGKKHRECTQCSYEESAKIPQLKCSKPTLKTISNTTNGVKITWGKVEGADSYRVYRKVKGGSWSKIGEVKTTYFTDKTAKSGTTYYYTVRAKNEAGLSSYNTSGVSIKRLATPALKTVSNTSTGVKITWGKVTGVSTYKVYRKTSKSGSWQYIGKTTSTSYTDKTAKKGTSYYYTVQAYSGSVKSSYNTDGLSVRCLSAPKISSAVSSTNGILVKWNKISGASGYYIYRKNTAGDIKKIGTVKGNTKIKYLDETPRKGATYNYYVKAYYSKSTSAYSSAFKVKCKY